MRMRNQSLKRLCEVR